MPYPVPDLTNKSEDECKASVQKALQEGHDRMCRMEKTQTAMKESLDENNAMTSQVVAILQAMAGGMKVLNWLGIGLKWIAGVGGAIYTLYCIWTGKSLL